MTYVNETIFSTPGELGQLNRVGTPSSIEDTIPTLGESLVAKFNYAYYADTSTGIRRDFNDNAGVDDDSVRSTINGLFDITGDERYKIRRQVSSKDRNKQIVGIEDYELLRDILQDEDALSAWREYRKQNPDALDLDDVLKKLTEAEEKRYNTLQSIINREGGGLLTDILGAGGAAFTDPVVLLTLPAGLAVRGGLTATVAAEAALGAGSEAVIQYGAAEDNYNFYGRENDPLTNVLAAGLFSGFLPVVAKGGGLAYRQVTNRSGKLVAEVDPESPLSRTIETETERLETLRSHAVAEEAGVVRGAEVPIHRVEDVDVRGLSEVTRESADAIGGVERLSTLRAFVDDDAAVEEIVGSLRERGLTLTDDLLDVFRNQEQPNLEQALEYQEFRRQDAPEVPVEERVRVEQERAVEATPTQPEGRVSADEAVAARSAEVELLDAYEDIKAAVREADEDLENLAPCII